MKIKIILLCSLIGIGISFCAVSPQNDEEKEKILIQALISGLNQMHYQPPKIDDAFSEKVFDLYLERLDGSKRFFLKSDIEAFEKYKKELDDQANMGDFEFFNLSLVTFNKRIDQVKGYYKEVLSQPFDFEKKEEIEFDEEKVDYASTEEELENYWRKLLKYRTMIRLNDLMEVQEKAKEDGNKEVKIKTYAELEEEARTKELDVHEKWFLRIDQLNRKDRLSTYLNAITSVYDPHTNYLPPKEKENFDINISGRLEGIGARLQSDGSETKVSSIVPGSASWSQGELEANDIILKVGQDDQEPVDVSGMRLDDIVNMVRGKKGTEVRLTVRKVDGTVKVIPIIRDIVVIEEGYAKSSLLESDKVKDEIGYIYLPRFYADFTKTGGRNCGDDVKKEITKLKDEGAKGIILDLRSNGGGSLRDVIQMAGLFIDEGPVVQVKNKIGKPQIKNDPERGVHYDGPLVIMVDAGSASASEILAAAMQDYGRAVIVGAPTFGKGTVQRFMDLDQAVPNGLSQVRPLGYVKFTSQKFYRIDGSTTQLNGVTPDITLPDPYKYLDLGEREYDYALAWDEIEPANYKKVKSLTDLKALVRASNARVQQNKNFTLVEENAKWLKEERDITLNSLNLDAYISSEENIEMMSDKFSEIGKEISGFTSSTLKMDLPSVNTDTTKAKQREEWNDNLEKDMYLEEAINIMNDLMNSPAYAKNK